MSDVHLRIRPTRAGEVGRPFIDLLYERAGPRRAQRVIAFMQGWGVIADELGRVPSVEEYAVRFQIPIATAYREQAAFRASFRSEETPDRILSVLWGELERRPPRHLLSTPVRVDIDRPAEVSTVLGWFVASLLDRLPAGAASAADRALPPLAGSARTRREEVTRAYRLADRAVFAWFLAILGREDPARAEGLASLERLQPPDAGPARYAAAILREYANALETRGLGPASEAAAGAAEAAAALGGRPRPSDLDAFAKVGDNAAATLIIAFSAGVVTEVLMPVRDVLGEPAGAIGLTPAASNS